MDAIDILQVLRGFLRKELNELQDAMASGSCQDFPDYKFQVGVIHGLAMAEAEVKELQDRIERD